MFASSHWSKIPASISLGAYDLGIVSLENVKSAIGRIIPFLFCVALLVGCGNSDSSVAEPITVQVRRSSIDAAIVHLDAGRILEALAITSTLVERDADSAQSQEAHALVLLADAARLDTMYQTEQAGYSRSKALEAYKTACAQSTNPGLLQLSAAQLAQMLGKDELAKQYYKSAHENVPIDSRASFFLAQIHMLQEEWIEAKQWIDASLERDQFEPFALLSSALIEVQLGSVDVAITRATQGCDINPNDPNLRFIQARVIRLSGNPDRALEILATLPKVLRESPIGMEERLLCLVALDGEIQ
jgi:tetratricopeptide (TPR) repeat protein